MPRFINDNIYNLIGSDSFLYQRVREADTTANVNILVLGASHAYRGIDPRVFTEKGYRLFNLGSSSQTPLQTQILLKNGENFDQYMENSGEIFDELIRSLMLSIK